MTILYLLEEARLMDHGRALTRDHPSVKGKVTPSLTEAAFMWLKYLHTACQHA
jgi:hypothetical protein